MGAKLPFVPKLSYGAMMDCSTVVREARRDYELLDNERLIKAEAMLDRLAHLCKNLADEDCPEYAVACKAFEKDSRRISEIIKAQEV